MPIKYYPNRVYRANEPAIDREIAKREPITVSGSQSIFAAGIDYYLDHPRDWQIDSIAFEFTNANARDYSAKIKNGRNVVGHLNDSFWLRTNTVEAQEITLAINFYDGDALAVEIASKLNANARFSSKGIVFAVTYDSTSGLFTITPNSGTAQYLSVNTSTRLSLRDSVAGDLFGFTQNSSLAASISSDTPVYGLNSEASIINQTASTATDHYHDDLHTLSMDQQLHIETGTANQTVVYTVVYEEMI